MKADRTPDETNTSRGRLQSFLHKQQWRWGLGLSVFLQPFIAFGATLSPESSTTNDQPESIFSFLTNCPPIDRLVLDAMYFSRLPTLFEFRYQDGAFHARQLSTADPSSPYFAVLEGTEYGSWDGDYWILEPPSDRPTLTTARDIGYDAALLRQKAGVFELVFSYFASFGITPGGVNSVVVDQNVLTAVTHSGTEDALRLTTSLVWSNGLPIGARIQPSRIHAKRVAAHPKPIELTYRYDTNVAPLPIPCEIILTQRVPRPGLWEGVDPSGADGVERTLLHLIVREIVLGRPSAPAPREMFVPPTALLGSNYTHVIITNGDAFQVKGDRLLPLAVPKDALQRELHQYDDASPLIMGLLLLLAFLVPLAVASQWKRRRQQQTKG